ncbi:hypothetical protein [uncultured Tateyamaria sp.]|uniref:hypothetical protein n=1 Tax=uncultured Tateyamaria sp. TaxID=455651 RepID=UPI002605B550|nr:hypothetical protein [uncultured Tateyamaria sp.]
MSNLVEFLDAPENSHAKESILMNKLFLDIKTSAAKRGYYLNTYFDTVDHDGFDVIFDDHDALIKTQLKSVRSDAKTNKWAIKKSVLRPSIEAAENLGFEFSPEGLGVGGGALLMKYGELDGSIVADYYYTDAYILSAFHHDVIRRKHASSRKALKTCLAGLRSGVGSKFLSVPKSAFLKAKDTDHLLALMCLHGPTSSFWPGNLAKLASYEGGLKAANELPSPPNKLRKFIWDEISELTDEPKLTHGSFEEE